MAFKQRWSLHGFHLRPIWLQFLVAIDSESCQRSFPSFCAPLLPMLCWSAATRAQLLILQSKPSIVFWNSLLEWLPMSCSGSNLKLNFNSVAWVLTNGLSRFYLLWSPKINCVEFEFFLKLQNWGQQWVNINPHPLKWIANKVCSQICRKWNAMFESHAVTIVDRTSFDFRFSIFFSDLPL